MWPCFPRAVACWCDQQDAGLRCLHAVLPWCMSHSFLVRLYALLTLGRVWGAACAPGAAERPAGPADGELRALAPLVEVCLRGAACMPAAGYGSWRRRRGTQTLAGDRVVYFAR